MYTHTPTHTRIKSLQSYRLKKVVEEGEARSRRSTTTKAVQAPKGLWDMSSQNRLFGSLLQFFTPGLLWHYFLLCMLMLLLDFLPKIFFFFLQEVSAEKAGKSPVKHTRLKKEPVILESTFQHRIC